MATSASEASTAETLFMLSSMVMYVMVWIASSRLLLRNGLRWWLGVPVAWCLTFAMWFVACMIAIGLDIPAPMTAVVLLGGVAALFSTRAKAAPTPMPPAIGAKPEAVPEMRGINTTASTTNAASDNEGVLVNLVEGMMADGVFVQAEAEYLFRWLAMHSEHLDQPPFNAIYSRLSEALADGVLDEDEAADLGDLFKRLVLDEATVVELISKPATAVATAVIEPVAVAKPRAKRAARKPSGPDIDRLLINYKDSMGFQSEREVTVKRLDGTYIWGYCHMRGALRSFRVDRIMGDVIRTETGELLSLEEWKDQLTIAS